MKEAGPAPGDLDAEARRLADEARNLVRVTFDAGKVNPNPQLNCLMHAFHSD